MVHLKNRIVAFRNALEDEAQYPPKRSYQFQGCKMDRKCWLETVGHQIFADETELERLEKMAGLRDLSDRWYS